MRYPVTLDPKNEGEIIELDMRDVVYFETSGFKTVVFHTLDNTYYPVVPMISTLERHVTPLGFRRLDRTNVVNLNRIEKYDRERSLVFFEPTITNISKFATISNTAKKDLEEWVSKNINTEE